MIDSRGSLPRFSAQDCALDEGFARADKDGDGRIDFGEFARLIHGLRAGICETDVRINFQKIDLDNDGLIDFGEFFDWTRCD